MASGGSAADSSRFESPFSRTVVTLLRSDHSGFDEEPLGLNCSADGGDLRASSSAVVSAKSSASPRECWDGGKPGCPWADAGYPPEPGRLNALEHIVIKPADVPWRRASGAWPVSATDARRTSTAKRAGLDTSPVARAFLNASASLVVDV